MNIKNKKGSEKTRNQREYMRVNSHPILTLYFIFYGNKKIYRCPVLDMSPVSVRIDVSGVDKNVREKQYIYKTIKEAAIEVPPYDNSDKIDITGVRFKRMDILSTASVTEQNEKEKNKIIFCTFTFKEKGQLLIYWMKRQRDLIETI